MIALWQNTVEGTLFAEIGCSSVFDELHCSSLTFLIKDGIGTSGESQMTEPREDMSRNAELVATSV